MMLADELEKHVGVLKEQNLLVIVEGKKDRAALNALGIMNVVTLKQPLFAVVEQVVGQTKECVILTDLDGEGRKLYARLSSDLQRFGVKINNKFRHFLFKETQVRQIEGLTTFLERNT